MNKFIEPTEMNGEAFFSRWKNLSMPAQVDLSIISQRFLSTAFQESQKIFKAEFPMENVEATKTKLIGYGFQLLEGRSAQNLIPMKLYLYSQVSILILTTLFALV